ncbi:MAG: hypothetical protein KKF62_18615 [Bacteroidetes bacterium]|nr:hypothetical protein [Bacteroidota bacterium]MBU1114397.1 hypothetical protein [Bacteroidota bacterium]MBU1798308.1 hypothetical protein [Bacteroidota bacterium]
MKKELLEKALQLYAGEKVLDRLHKLGEKALDPFYEKHLLTLYGQDLKSMYVNGEVVSLDELMQFKYDYMNLLTNNIRNHSGYIEHYERDFILTFWETEKKFHATDACKCALDAIKIAEQMNEKWNQYGISNIKSKIGIVTGNVLLGNFGSDHRLMYSLSGEIVNFLHKVVDANTKFNTQILVSQTTKVLTTEEISFIPVEEIMIKGKKEPEILYAIN